MKKVLVTILVILVIGIGVGLGYVYYNFDKKIDEQNDKIEKISEIENSIDNLNNQVNKLVEQEDNKAVAKESENNTNSSSEENSSTSSVSKEEKNVNFDSNKMKLSNKNKEYIEDKSTVNYGIKLSLQNGKAYISTDSTNETYKVVFKSTTSLELKEITGFNTKIRDVYIAYIGNGLVAPTLLFLMEDGTVEYAYSDKVIDEQDYESEGKLGDLKNIVKFTDVSLFEAEDDNYMSVVAIDSDGYSYDINEIINKY